MLQNMRCCFRFLIWIYFFSRVSSLCKQNLSKLSNRLCVCHVISKLKKDRGLKSFKIFPFYRRDFSILFRPLSVVTVNKRGAIISQYLKSFRKKALKKPRLKKALITQKYTIINYHVTSTTFPGPLRRLTTPQADPQAK